MLISFHFEVDGRYGWHEMGVEGGRWSSFLRWVLLYLTLDGDDEERQCRLYEGG